MAKKKEEFDYSAEIKKLKAGGPGRLYLLYGEEDYLRDRYLETLKSLCIPEGESGFNFKRIDGPGLDVGEVEKAIDQMPFLSDRTFLELRNADINKLADADRLIAVLSSVPDYCTVCFVQEASYETDGRLKFVKFLKDKGVALQFVSQGQDKLFSWIKRRFEAAGKEIDKATAQRLVFISGDLMNSLIPEIEKIAAYSKGRTILPEDVEAVANHIPEADVFEMVNLISEKKNNAALHLLSELLSNKENAPVGILAFISSQFRRLYGVKLALKEGRRRPDIMDMLNIRYDFIADKLIASAGKFSLGRLAAIVQNCAEAEYSMKSSGGNDTEVLKTLVIKLMAGEQNG